MMAKAYALGALAAISFAIPLLEAAVTGRLEPLSSFALAQILLTIPPVYWWYHIDKTQRQYRAGPLLNVAVVAVAVLALPYYFIRTRGWKRGLLSIGKGIGVFVVIGVLGVVGEIIGSAIAS